MGKLEEEILKIDNGRFKKIVGALSISDACEKCYYFMPTITDIRKGYRCRCAPGCIAATLHPELQSYLWWKLGFISEREHRINIGIKTEDG